MIRKMYGPSVQLEEINKLVSEGVSNYITEEKLEILGDPLPNRNENESIDFDTQEEFTFSFDLGIAPEFEIKISGRNKVTRYEVKIDKKLKSDFLENYQRRFGEHTVADVAEEEDMLKGDISRLSDEGEIVEGTEVQDSRLSIKVIKDDKIKKTFIGKKAGEVIEFDIQKAFPNDF